MSHDDVEARRALLEVWLSRIEAGYSVMESTVKERMAENPIGAVQVPNMEIYPPSQDMMDVMTDGLRRAIRGEPDPFKTLSPRGKKPLLNRADKLRLAIQVLELKEAGENELEAFEIVAESFSVSPSTAKTIFYEWKGWAYIHTEAYRKRLFS